MAAAEVASVAFDAYALSRLASQNGANLDSLDARIFDLLDLVLVDHLVGGDQHFAGERVVDIFERDASEHAIAETFDYFAAFDQRRHLDSVQRPPFILANHLILPDADHPPRPSPPFHA